MRYFAYIWLLAGFVACENAQQNETDPLLASVHQHKLFLSDALPVLTDVTSPADSISQLRSYVQFWVREAALLHEAEQNLPRDVNINDLVTDYRNSLLISNYEKNMVESQVDTVISNDELQQYYQDNKEQYQLETPIVRAHFVKLRKSTPDLLQFREWWDSDDSTDFVQLIDYSNRYADVFMLEDSTWYQVEEIEGLMPPGTWRSENMRPNTSLRFTDADYEYYLRISEGVLSTEIAPLSYIREQAVRYIMHKRKLTLLDKVKNDLYQRDLKEEHINIYIE